MTGSQGQQCGLLGMYIFFLEVRKIMNKKKLKMVLREAARDEDECGMIKRGLLVAKA